MNRVWKPIKVHHNELHYVCLANKKVNKAQCTCMHALMPALTPDLTPMLNYAVA